MTNHDHNLHREQQRVEAIEARLARYETLLTRRTIILVIVIVMVTFALLAAGIP
jgi:uncharacterized membrane protein